MMFCQRETLKGFFVLEGLDGSGTTTQLRRIEARARDAGLLFRADFEPTAHPVGKMIRSALKGEMNLTRRTLAHLFAADRQEHIEGPEGIRTFTTQRGLVLSDRYFFSSLAYQSQDLTFEEVQGLNASFPLPEAVFFLDIDVKTAQGRIQQRGGTAELFDAADLQEKIRLAYEKSFAAFPELELVRLDARLSPEALSDLIWERICR